MYVVVDSSVSVPYSIPLFKQNRTMSTVKFICFTVDGHLQPQIFFMLICASQILPCAILRHFLKPKPPLLLSRECHSDKDFSSNFWAVPAVLESDCGFLVILLSLRGECSLGFVVVFFFFLPAIIREELNIENDHWFQQRGIGFNSPEPTLLKMASWALKEKVPSQASSYDGLTMSATGESRGGQLPSDILCSHHYADK